jgi:hypothetical protein
MGFRYLSEDVLISFFFDSEILAVMSSAYNSKVCQFPIEHFCSLFSINDPAYCRELCALHRIETSETGIKFIKTNYVSAKVKDATGCFFCLVKYFTNSASLFVKFKFFQNLNTNLVICHS